MATKVRKRYRNKTEKLQLVYDEYGVKREVPPNGTVLLDPKLGSRFSGILEEVLAKK